MWIQSKRNDSKIINLLQFSIIETCVKVNQKFADTNAFTTWRDQLYHPGSYMMLKLIENSYGHSLKNQKIF